MAGGKAINRFVAFKLACDILLTLYMVMLEDFPFVAETETCYSSDLKWFETWRHIVSSVTHNGIPYGRRVS